MKRIRWKPKSQIATVLLLALWAGTTPAQTADTEPRCMLVCDNAKPGEMCKVRHDEASKGAPALNRDKFTYADNCNKLSVTSSSGVIVRYRHKGKWFDPPQALTSPQHLGQVFGQFKADPCGVPTRECLQSRMGEKSASTASHGADSLATNPAGTGSPCILGLPCGTILPPAPQWRFLLTDPATSGTWRARYLRGTPPAGMPAEISAQVAQGEVVAEGAYFQPGAVIAYRLLDAAGAVRVTGEFEIAGNSRLARLKMLASARAERHGLTESAAWMDTLASSELDWDVQQLSASR